METPDTRISNAQLAAQPVEETPRVEAFANRLDRWYPSGFDREIGEWLSWPEFARLLERELTVANRQLSLAHTENAGHIRIEDELKSDLAQAQARCAELEKAVLGECEECGHTIISPLHHLSSVEKDAARYRWLRETMPMTIGSALKWPYYPAQYDYDVFDAKIDAAISAGKP